MVCFLFIPFEQLRDNRNIFFNRIMRKQAVILQNITDAAPQDFGLLFKNVYVVYKDAAVGWLYQPVKHF